MHSLPNQASDAARFPRGNQSRTVGSPSETTFLPAPPAWASGWRRRGRRALRGFPPRDSLQPFFAERACWWGRPEPTPASRTSWKGAPSITVPGPPRGLRSASRYRLTTPVSDICHSQPWTPVSKTRPVQESTPRSLCTHLACLGGLCCGLCRSLEKSAFFFFF